MDELKKTLKSSRAMRWTVLVLISLIMFGTYWFQDFMSGLKPMMESELGITSSDFGTIIQWTTLANVFGMIIVGGIFLDRFGIRLAGLVFGAVAVVGSAVTALGASGVLSEDTNTQMWIMMVGRLLFGIGLEITCVICSKTLVKWFKGYELALAFAVNMGIGRLGSAIGTMFSIDIAGDHLSPAFFFAASLIAIGFLGFLVYLIFDVKLDKQLKETGEQDAGGEEERFRISDLGKLATNPSFVLITLLCVFFYSAVFPFMQYAPDLLVNKFGFSVTLDLSQTNDFWEKVKLFFTNGNKVAGLVPWGTILFTMIFGRIVDKKGKAATLMILGSLLLIFSHLALSVFNSLTLGYIGLVTLGVAFSLVPAAMWPSVAKIVPESRLGTAYASMFTIQNWGLMAFFKGIGSVLDMVNPEVVEKMQTMRDKLLADGLSIEQVNIKMEALRQAGEIPAYDYTYPILMLVACGVISIFLALMLRQADKKQKYGLELPS